MISQGKISTRLVQKRLEAEDIVSLRLRAEGDSPLPAFSAGAHVDIEIAPDIVRQYSLCGVRRAGTEYELAVLREPASRGGSGAVHDRLQVGQTIMISEPKNHFPLVAEAAHSMLFAGGIGVTPILAMAEELHGTGQSFALHYCGRSANRMAFRGRVETGPLAPFAALHFDDGPQGQQLNLDQAIPAPADDVHIYVCGPAGFIAAVLTAAEAKGWPDSQLHREYFAVPADAATDAADAPFTVEIASSGLRFEIPAGKSIATVLDENGIFVPTSCSEGICGTCVINVLEGVPDHRDFVLTKAEHSANDRMTLCCSRAKSTLLRLDL